MTAARSTSPIRLGFRSGIFRVELATGRRTHKTVDAVANRGRPRTELSITPDGRNVLFSFSRLLAMVCKWSTGSSSRERPALRIIARRLIRAGPIAVDEVLELVVKEIRPKLLLHFPDPIRRPAVVSFDTPRSDTSAVPAADTQWT